MAARDALVRALSFAGERNRLRASLRYCEGHLHRINGEAQKTRGDGDEGQEELANAVVAFREASDVRQDWPDPFLGHRLGEAVVVGVEQVLDVEIPGELRRVVPEPFGGRPPVS